jgi:cytochrome c oxidase assembly protein subunit 11
MLFALCLLVLVMFLFGFALVPLYDVMCRSLNINGKVYAEESTTVAPMVDSSRTVTVQFITTNNAAMPWVFKPQQFSMDTHPGENKRIDFYAENTTDDDMTVQAIPSITPHEAAPYMRKTQCFCFSRQFMKAHGHRLMPVIFHLDPALPKHIDTVTLSYTLFDISHMKTKAVSPDVVGHPVS